MSVVLGAGAIVSNPTDLNIFIESLFAGKIISVENLNIMKTIKDNFGMGIFEFFYFDKKSYRHTGNIDGFRSMLDYFSDDKLAIAITSNGVIGYYNDNILLCALSSYFNKPYKMPTFNNIEIPTTTLDLYIGTYASSQVPLKNNY